MTERPSRASVRIEQPADPADVRAVGYGPDDVPVVPDKYARLPVHKEESGRGGDWNGRLMEPAASAVYIVDRRYLYVTDDHGRVSHAEGWLGWLPTAENDERRNVEAQREAGVPDRQRTDDGGHLFAVRAIDRAGNKGDPARVRFRVDTNAPRLRIKGPGEVKTTRARASALFIPKASEPVDRVCRVNSKGFKPCSQRYRTPRLGKGPHMLKVRAIDRAGNVTTRERTFRVMEAKRKGHARRGSARRSLGADAVAG